MRGYRIEGRRIYHARSCSYHTNAALIVRIKSNRPVTGSELSSNWLLETRNYLLSNRTEKHLVKIPMVESSADFFDILAIQ